MHSTTPMLRFNPREKRWVLIALREQPQIPLRIHPISQEGDVMTISWVDAPLAPETIDHRRYHHHDDALVHPEQEAVGSAELLLAHQGVLQWGGGDWAACIRLLAGRRVAYRHRVDHNHLLALFESVPAQTKHSLVLVGQLLATAESLGYQISHHEMQKQVQRTLTHISTGEWGTCLVPLAPTDAYEVWLAPTHGLTADSEIGEVLATLLQRLTNLFPHERWRVEITAGIPSHTGEHALIRVYSVTTPAFALGLPLLPETLIRSLLS